MDLQFVISFLSIVVIDLVLAGDNAVVIAMAAHRLEPTQRKRAIFIGAALAVILRVLTTFVVAQLLQVPFLSAVGGLLVGWIAVKLLLDEGETETADREVKGFWHAIWIIAVADFIMSTDNIIAIGGASGGHFGLILFGLGLSIPIIMFCSNWIAGLMDRYSWLAEVGAGILGWTAGQMIAHDRKVIELLRPSLRSVWPIFDWGIRVVLAVGVILIAKGWMRLRASQGGPAEGVSAVAVDNPPHIR
ncbi:MAG: TerC family protein [candidate division NC10 bacterium]|nr:TerC family protein [candidate division NC10 bacterium]